LSDVFIRCPECQGRRYRPHVIDVKLSPRPEIRWSIADLLEASVDEAIVFLRLFPDSKPAVRALGCLGYLQEVGLGYVCLGQPINTLSGGECQRLKLVRHLAAFEEGNRKSHQPAVFIFDEPTTGLHFEDVRILMRALRRLVTAGHSLIVVEHNLQVIRMADWIIDLGPGAGADGGRIVVEGTPETVTQCAESLTGAALRQG
jgi:excinuclease ABC subunit A